MDKILFASRLKEQIEIKYKTQTAFAIEYDRKFNPGTFCNEANSPHKGTLSTIKKYVSSTAPTIPSLDKIDNMFDETQWITEVLELACSPLSRAVQNTQKEINK